MHFARLSIIDLSQDGMQPMHSSCGRYVMTFNGEIINFRDLAAQYGLVLRGHSDSEVLLELYRILGNRVAEVLRGMFAFVVYDKRERSAVAFRDPFGIKPLYYAQQGGSVYLSSEIKPLLRAVGEGEINTDQAIRFLRRGEVDCGEDTFYRGIKQLSPGHLLTWNDGRLSTQRYQKDVSASGVALDEKSEQAAYHELLLKTVGEYLFADVPVGVSLSGGLDSSLLAHLVKANRAWDQPVPMFTRGYLGYEGNELEAARQVGRRCGFEVYPVLLDPEEVPSLLRRCSEQQEHPVTSISILVFHRLYQEARARGVKVLLEGHGGDELWAGYAYYEKPLSPNQAQDGSSFHWNDEVVKEECIPGDSPETPWGLAFPAASELTRRQMNDLFGAKLQRSLRFVDRASMQEQVEVRVPYLDTEVAVRALCLPDAWKIRNGNLRDFIRQMARVPLGDAVALRPKVSVQDPQRKWLQKELAGFVRDLLASHSLFIDAFVDRNKLRCLYEDFLKDSARFDNVTFLVFPVFLEEWHRAMAGYLKTPRKEEVHRE